MGLYIQRTFFDDNLGDWTPPQEFPKLHGTIALDIETYDPRLDKYGPGWFTKDGFITGVAIAGEDFSYYYPTRHYGGNLDEGMVFRWLRGELGPGTAVKELIIFNRMYDEGWLRHRYNVDIRCPIEDPLTAAPLIDENRFSYSLDSCGKTYLQSKKDKGSLQEAAKLLGIDKPWSCMHEFPAPFVGPYAEQDTRLTWDLWKVFKQRLSDEELWPIYGLEIRLVNVLLEMRRKGVLVDLEKAERTGKKFQTNFELAMMEIKKLTGHQPDVWNAIDIAKMLDAINIPYERTKKTDAPSITKTFLEGMKHPVGKLLRKARRYSTAKGTFVDGHIMSHEVNGRIHGEFYPLRKDDEHGAGGAVTGRFSSAKPNLQNLPAPDDKDEIKQEISELVRGCFLPWEGEEWGAMDYSSQEPRLGVHFAHVSNIRGVEEFVTGYREDPRMDFHSKGAAICGLPRKQAKNMTLGKMYGMGGAKLCHSLGLPTQFIQGRDGKMIEIAGPEGQKIIDRYNDFMPWVSGLSELAMNRAKSRGFIRTIAGRKRRFEPVYKGGAYDYKALNCLIQGSAADMIKLAMVNLYEQLGVVPLVTVHDEVGLSVPSRDMIPKYMEVITESTKLCIPVVADIEIGPNWGEAKVLEPED